MTRAANEYEIADRERDLRKADWRPSDLTVSQRFALAKLVGFAEGVVSSGLLGDGEFKARAVIAEAIAAFGMLSRSEMERQNVR